MNPNHKYIYIVIAMLLMAISAKPNEVAREFRTINAANELADNSAQAIACTEAGRMIISTLGNLNFYDGATFTHIDTNQEYALALPQYRGNYRICMDSLNHLWLKNTQSVTCADLTSEIFVKDLERFVRDMGCEGTLQDLFTDEAGGLWFLTDKGLYNTTDKIFFQPLRDRNLQELGVFGDMLVTFYDNGEVLIYNIKTAEVLQHSKAYEWEEAHRYMQSAIKIQYADGYFLIKNGKEESVLLQFNVRNHEWKTILEAPITMNDMTLYNEKLYVAAGSGYFVYDLKTAALSTETIKLVGGRELKPTCNAIAIDRQGGLWIGTESRGVLYARPTPSPFQVYDNDTPVAQQYIAMMRNIEQNITDFRGIQANCMFKDSRNWTWIGTSVGLYLYRSPKEEPIVYNRKHGLLNNVIHAIVEDKHKNIWVSTSYGVSCILFDKNREVLVNNFNQADKVPNESFVNCKAMLLEDGNIIMQGIDHVIKFHPDSFTVNSRKTIKMYPKLIKLMVNGYFVKPHQEVDGEVIIDRAIHKVKDLHLNANQNSLSLTFSGLNYFRPIQTCYRYRVSGIQKDWKVCTYFNGSEMVDSRGQFHLPLVGLEPGDYKVEVEVSMFPDTWDEVIPYTLAIHINQPWWKRRGVYMLMLGLIFTLVIVNFYFYNKNTRMRVRRNAEEGDMIRKIKSFLKQCNSYDGEAMMPTEEELYGNKYNENSGLSPRFIELMLKITPFVSEQRGQVSLRQLSELGDIDIVEFYNLMTSNLYKNPRELMRVFRIEKAAQLLKTTNKTIEEISSECGFYTPNYFIGCFFHRFKMTPREYREENS